MIGLCIVMLSGCSSKYPSIKTGAIIGGVTAAITTVAIGTKNTNSDDIPLIATAAVIIGLFGVGVGAGTGYIVDSIKDNNDEIQEIIQSQNIKGLDK